MAEDKKFDSILDECLERLLVKGETIEQCLQSYPGQVAELEPLLRTALTAGQVVAIQPRASFKAQARYQFRTALREWASRGSRLSFSWLPRWATVVAVIVVLLLAGGGTVAVASNSMPDSFLYPVKLATEQVQLALTPSDVDKAELHAKFANRRVAEIVYMADKGDTQQVEVLVQRLDERLVKLASLTSPELDEAPAMLQTAPSGQLEKAESSREVSGENGWGKLRTIVTGYAVSHPAALRAELDKVPEAARPALRRAIAISEAGYRRVLQGLD